MKRDRMCCLCRQDLPPSAYHTWSLWACKECWKTYMVFRRAFLKEYGHWPTVKEFRTDG